jgi:cytochrome c oxidase subunit II
MNDTPHFTTRRGFIAAAGFGGTALYGLWVGLGAAPGPLALLGASHADAGAGNTDHAGHATPEAPPLTPAEFEARVQDFVARFREADGSVRPSQDDVGHGTMGGHAHAGPVAGHAGAEHHDDPGQGHGVAGHAPTARIAAQSADAGKPVDVWLQAGQFHFTPWHLRLVTHQPYRLRMMATDVSHGASIQFGRGGRMIRLRPGQLVETGLTLLRPGDYLIHCTVYCGAAHDAMQARLSVTDGGAP